MCDHREDNKEQKGEDLGGPLTSAPGPGTSMEMSEVHMSSVASSHLLEMHPHTRRGAVNQGKNSAVPLMTLSLGSDYRINEYHHAAQSNHTHTPCWK